MDKQPIEMTTNKPKKSVIIESDLLQPRVLNTFDRAQQVKQKKTIEANYPFEEHGL